MKKIKLEILPIIFWIFFGVLNGLSYYWKGEYWISGIMFLLGILYLYSLYKAVVGRKDRTADDKIK